MITLTALVSTRHFPEKIKTQDDLLKPYVIDYADCSMLLLERLGHYRYCQLCEYISGEKEPYKLISTLRNQTNDSYFCNENKIGISLSECTSVSTHPDEYALVLYNCFS